MPSGTKFKKAPALQVGQVRGPHLGGMSLTHSRALNNSLDSRSVCIQAHACLLVAQPTPAMSIVSSD